MRSGTTLLRLMLGHHTRICRCEEMEYVAPALAEAAGWPDLDRYRHGLSLHRGFRMSGYDVDPALPFPELARSFLDQRRRLDGRPLVGATVHNHFERLPRIWPRARYLFLERDPRDVARSCAANGFVGSAWRGAELWLAARESWQRLGEHVPAERRMALRFEALVTEPEPSLAAVCDFLGVAYEPGMLEIDRDTSYARPDPAAAASWRGVAPDREIREIEARVGAWLGRAGYAESGLPALSPSRLRSAWLRVRDRAGLARFRIRRYGVGLWLASLLADRLPRSAWRDRVALRRNAVDNAHLR